MINLVVGIASLVCFLSVGILRARWHELTHASNGLHLVHKYDGYTYDKTYRTIINTVVTKWEYYGINVSACVREGGNCFIEMKYTHDNNHTKHYFRAPGGRIWLDYNDDIVLDPSMSAILNSIWSKHIDMSYSL